MQFKQTLTNEESERYAYISGDVKSAEMYERIADLETNEEDLSDLRNQLWSVESELDESKAENDELNREVTELEDKLEKYKTCVKGLNNIYQVLPAKARELLSSLE